MLDIKEMIEDIKEDYVRDVNRRDSRYALAKLWDNFNDDDPDEEMILYNLIIAHFNIESGEVTVGQRKCITNTLDNYKDSSQEVKKVLDDEGNRVLQEVIDYIEKYV